MLKVFLSVKESLYFVIGPNLGTQKHFYLFKGIVDAKTDIVTITL